MSIHLKIKGIVKKNLGRGRKLGFPTANFEAPAGVEDGLYYSLVRVPDEEKQLLGLTFAGKAVTFGETVRNLETYILDFNDDLYGQEIEVKLIEKLRGNIKFDSEAELIAQMKQDELDARQFFKTYGRTE